MKKAIFWFLLYSLFSCLDYPEKPAASVVPPLNQNDNYEAIIIRKWNQEYLPFDSVLVNGNTPIVTTKKKLYALLGKPDEIIPMRINRNNLFLIEKDKPKKAYYLVYGNTIFEGYGEYVIANTIDFESTDVELVHPKITLKKGMRPIEIQRVFPESGRLLAGSGNAWSGHIMVSASKPNGGLHDVWFIIFRAEKLYRVVLYSVPGSEDLSF